MIDMQELMTDPDFAISYTVMRTKGKWYKGRFKLGEPVKLKFFGPVQPATAEELQQIPEGDRTQEIMKFMCAPPNKIYVTTAINSKSETDGIISDQIIYDGDLYKVIRSKNWRNNGYTRAFAYCIGEASDNGYDC